MAFEVQNFQEDVIQASHNTPVLVDFWAPWCGPCRVLGPVLEKLAAEQSDQWTLVKVNTDQDQSLSMQYGIRGIPAVKLFVDGTVVDEFTGALPEYAVRQWLEKALPSENKAHVSQAEAALEAGDTATAETLLEAVLATEPTNAQASAMLAQVLVFRDAARAAALAEAASTAEPRFLQVAEAVKTIARMLDVQQAPGTLPDAPIRPRYLQALDALATHDFDTALEHFIAVIQQDRYYDDDHARKACIALFTLLGPQHEVTRKHRRIFDMALY